MESGLIASFRSLCRERQMTSAWIGSLSCDRSISPTHSASSKTPLTNGSARDLRISSVASCPKMLHCSWTAWTSAGLRRSGDTNEGRGRDGNRRTTVYGKEWRGLDPATTITSGSSRNRWFTLRRNSVVVRRRSWSLRPNTQHRASRAQSDPRVKTPTGRLPGRSACQLAAPRHRSVAKPRLCDARIRDIGVTQCSCPSAARLQSLI